MILSNENKTEFKDGFFIIINTQISDKPFVQPDKSDPNIIVFDGYKNVFGDIATDIKPKVYTKRTQYVYNILTGISYRTTGYY